MALYAIACTFKLTEHSEAEHGMAICSDPDTVITFIHANGMAVIETEIWNYKLQHFMPWAKILD